MGNGFVTMGMQLRPNETQDQRRLPEASADRRWEGLVMGIVERSATNKISGVREEPMLSGDAAR